MSVHDYRGCALGALAGPDPVAGVRMPHRCRRLARSPPKTDITTAAENGEHCVKWGMGAGTPEHLDCIHDLVTIQARSEERVRDEPVIGLLQRAYRVNG